MNNSKLLINYAYQLLAAKRYTRKELLHKLSLKNARSESPLTDTELQQIVARFENSGIINDTEYANLYLISQESRKPQGIFAIKHKLQHKGVSKQIIQNALAQNPPDEIKSATRLVEKVMSTSAFKQLPSDKQKLTLLRRLAARGFSGKTASKIIKDCDLPLVD